MLLEFDKSENKGVRLTHKNEYIDDYDPVVSFKILNGRFIINNTYCTYTVPVSQVSLVELYDSIFKVDEEFEEITWDGYENFQTIWTQDKGEQND